MGCVVNGPGEAREADIGIAGGKGEAVLFLHGKPVKSSPVTTFWTSSWTRSINCKHCIFSAATPADTGAAVCAV